MTKKFPALTCVFLFALATVGAQTETDSSRKVWVGHYDRIASELREGEIVNVERIGMGVTNPWRVYLLAEGRELSAAFKPIKRGRQKGFWESYEAEIAAYVVDRLLELDMVPPTVERRVEGESGSLQLWVDDCKLYRDVEGQEPRTPQWMYQLSRMKMFDVLINNEDRNAQNFLVDPAFNVVLIDHSRAFITGKRILSNPSKLPNYFDRKNVEKLKLLTRELLDDELGDLLMGGQIQDILERRDALLAHLDDLIKERGEAGVLFN